MSIIVIRIVDDGVDSSRLDHVLSYALDNTVFKHIELKDIENRANELKNSKILFAVKIGEDGVSESFFKLLSFLRKNTGALENSNGAVVVDACGELYSKSMGRELVYTANLSGCAFMGRPLVEATGSLLNFLVQAKAGHTNLKGAYKEAVRDLAERLQSSGKIGIKTESIAVIHASDPNISNTFALWNLIKARLPKEIKISEVNLRNGSIIDCRGCPYDTCLHFGEQGGCFYGGPMVEEVYPALLNADTLMLLCPNYNDALSASLTAFINRLTALFRVRRFYDKKLAACIVSGYSGSDLIAAQLISALNMNKSFYLPPRFSIYATANDSGTLLNIPGIEAKAADYAKRLL